MMVTTVMAMMTKKAIFSNLGKRDIRFDGGRERGKRIGCRMMRLVAEVVEMA